MLIGKENQVVSANYKNRKSPYKWLMRDQDQGISQAQEFKAIKATNVIFKPSNKSEEGFGCTAVAFCATAEGFDIAPEFNKEEFKELQFKEIGVFSWGFFEKGTQTKIEKIELLYLTENGSMYAQVKVLEPVTLV